MTTQDFDVVIIGLGPAGGTLANLLAMNNLSILVLEKEASIYNLPRAVHFDDEVMRVFNTIGITKSLTKKDFEEILEANKKMNELVSNLKKDLDELDKRFSKKQRDLGKLAIDRTDAVQRVINKASESAKRCVEIASGSPLTESEIKATKKSEANSECPSIANPNYVPY